MRKNRNRLIIAVLSPYTFYYVLASMLFSFITLQVLTGYLVGMPIIKCLEKVDEVILELSILVTGFGIISILLVKLVFTRVNTDGYSRHNVKTGSYIASSLLGLQYISGFMLWKSIVFLSQPITVLLFIVSGFLGIIVFSISLKPFIFHVLGKTTEAEYVSKLFSLHFIPLLGVLLLLISLLLLYLAGKDDLI